MSATITGDRGETLVYSVTTNAARIRLDLPSEEDLKQQRLSLLIDSSPGRQGVAPSGYLSDSQIHSLALALRLAAIATFNARAPIAILDDIVTSYDADHRRTVATMLASNTANLQIILTTHDQRFFSYLKDQLGDSRWAYSQITRLDRDYGPRFAGTTSSRCDGVTANWQRTKCAKPKKNGCSIVAVNLASIFAFASWIAPTAMSAAS